MASKLDYRVAKKMLNRYHKFSFEMPRKGKDFKPQQKAAITRQFNKLGKLILASKNDKATFLKGEKLENGVKTNRGTFFNYPEAKVKKNKKKKIKLVEVKIGKRREVYIPFSKKLQKDLDAIEKYVAEFEKKLKPDYIRWATKGQLTSEVYNPGTYKLYDSQLFIKETVKNVETKRENYLSDPFYIGVFFGWAPDNS